MKKLSFSFLFLCSSLFALAQGTLQFNQALLMTNGNSLTVPSGKVWKVVSATVGDGVSFGDNIRFFITINGAENHLNYFSGSGSYGARSNTMPALPLWLPANTTVAVPAFGSNSNQTRIRNISILEFNIVP